MFDSLGLCPIMALETFTVLFHSLTVCRKWCQENGMSVAFFRVSVPLLSTPYNRSDSIDSFDDMHLTVRAVGAQTFVNLSRIKRGKEDFFIWFQNKLMQIYEWQTKLENRFNYKSICNHIVLIWKEKTILSPLQVFADCFQARKNDVSSLTQ